MRKLALILATAALTAGVSAASAGATIYGGNFCQPNGTYVFLNSGADCTHGTYHGDHRYIENKSSPYSGLPGVYLVNSAGTRITNNKYCDTLGCTAWDNFTSSGWGYANAHNHGGYGSNFQGYLNYNE